MLVYQLPTQDLQELVIQKEKPEMGILRHTS